MTSPRAGELQERAADGDAPLREQPLRLLGVERRLVARGRRPGELESLDTRPGADGKSGQRRGAECGRLTLRGYLDGDPREIGLKLHQEAVGRRAAVGPQDVELDLHRIEHVARLEGDCLERRTDEMLALRPARQSRDQSACLWRPVRRTESGKRRNEVDALVAVERTRERLGLGRALDQAEPVAEPLDRRARDETAPSSA